MIAGLQKLWHKVKTMRRVLLSDSYVFMEPAMLDGTVVMVDLDSYGLEPMQIWDCHLVTTSTLLEIIAAEQIEALNDLISPSDVSMELCDAGFSPN